MRYRLWIRDEAKAEIRQLPGHMRQRVRRAIQDLGDDPRPHYSRELSVPENRDVEARRLRLDRWRIVYVVDENWVEVGILAARQRPPCDYDDLSELLSEFDAS
jgi:mRNA interferase RelE/StbE